MKWNRFKHKIKRYWIMNDFEPLLMLGLVATLIGTAILNLLQGFKW